MFRRYQSILAVLLLIVGLDRDASAATRRELLVRNAAKLMEELSAGQEPFLPELQQEAISELWIAWDSALVLDIETEESRVQEMIVYKARGMQKRSGGTWTVLASDQDFDEQAQRAYDAIEVDGFELETARLRLSEDRYGAVVLRMCGYTHDEIATVLSKRGVGKLGVQEASNARAILKAVVPQWTPSRTVKGTTVSQWFSRDIPRALKKETRLDSSNGREQQLESIDDRSNGAEFGVARRLDREEILDLLADKTGIDFEWADSAMVNGRTFPDTLLIYFSMLKMDKDQSDKVNEFMQSLRDLNHMRYDHDWDVGTYVSQNFDLLFWRLVERYVSVAPGNVSDVQREARYEGVEIGLFQRRQSEEMRRFVEDIEKREREDREDREDLFHGHGK